MMTDLSVVPWSRPPTEGRLAHPWLRRLKGTSCGLAVGVALLTGSPASAQETPAAKPDDTWVWHDLARLGIGGKGWTDTAQPFDRLPAKAEGLVRAPVWNFGQDSTGLYVCFVTDADALRARWKLRKPNRLAMPHMAASGVSGLDLYVRDVGKWMWLGIGAPDKNVLNERPLVRGMERGRREYRLYLPLYNGVDSLELGVPAGSSFEPAPDRDAGRKPVVFYGSSRLQGACASRPGMAYPSIVGRALDWPVINLGFSGNAKTEPEVARLLAEIDASAYVLDSLPNLTVEQTQTRMEPFIRILRARHPTTPIILVELVDYADAKFVAARRDKANGSNTFLRELFHKLKEAGDSRLYYVSAAPIVALGNDGTVDGGHQTDLGFQRMADEIAPIVRTALRKSAAMSANEISP